MQCAYNWAWLLAGSGHCSCYSDSKLFLSTRASKTCLGVASGCGPQPLHTQLTVKRVLFICTLGYTERAATGTLALSSCSTPMGHTQGVLSHQLWGTDADDAGTFYKGSGITKKHETERLLLCLPGTMYFEMEEAHLPGGHLGLVKHRWMAGQCPWGPEPGHGVRRAGLSPSTNTNTGTWP